MTALVFVDTNVLVYSVLESDMDKRDRCREWLDHLWAEGTGRLSFQVLQEFYSVSMRLRPDRAANAQESIRALFSWRPVQIGTETLEMAWDLQSVASLSWWDALIVAAAKQAGSGLLLTEDLQHGQRFGDVEVVNPFRAGPATFVKVDE